MAKHRASRLAGEIQKEIAAIIARELKDPRLAGLSVISVDVAKDGCSAHIYLSPLSVPAPPSAEIEQAIDSAKGFIRRALSQRLQVRNVPELYFHLDASIARAIRMTGLIDAQIAADEEAARGRSPIDENTYKSDLL
ncbi:MAG: 30S ribosome-binding factor RbfA [Clostridiales bacterium]|nr:30S ribosome-binding factor RbfA [Clostridiales bacterium]